MSEFVGRHYVAKLLRYVAAMDGGAGGIVPVLWLGLDGLCAG